MSKMKGASLEQSIPAPSGADEMAMEDDMRTMHQAAKIAADPSKLKKVHKLAGRRHKALVGMIEPLMKKKPAPRSTADLRKLSNEKAMADEDGEF